MKHRHCDERAKSIVPKVIMVVIAVINLPRLDLIRTLIVRCSAQCSNRGVLSDLQGVIRCPAEAMLVSSFFSFVYHHKR